MRERIRTFFKDSETIFWARFQMFMSAVIAVLATIDPNMFMSYVPAAYVPIYLFASGLITELARRMRETNF